MNTKWLFILAFLFGLGGVSCSKSELEDFDSGELSPVTLSAGALAADPVVNNETVLVEWEVNLSGPATQAFEVSIGINTDTVNKVLAAGAIENAVALGGDALVVPANLKVQYGTNRAILPVEISRTVLERNFGKNVVFALQMLQAGKGNKIEKSTGILVLNTSSIMTAEDLHYVGFEKGGEILHVGNRQNYQATSAGIEIPLNIHLDGTPSRSFSIRGVLNNDTIATLIDQELLPANTIVMPAGSYNIDSVVVFGGSDNTVPLNLVVPWPLIENNIDTLLALAVDLVDPTRHVLHPGKSQIVVLINPKNVVETDATADGVLSVSKDNNGGPEAGEGSLKVVDGDTGTKFLNEYPTDLWMELAFAEPELLRAYTLTSANDAEGRDPKDWTLRGSNDGTIWVDLDSRSGEVFTERFQTKRYDFENDTAFRYYRIYITANNGSNLFQLAEWRLIRVP